jgi:hypothetical protein
MRPPSTPPTPPLAPPSPVSPLYGFLRLAHITLIAAVMPLGMLHFLADAPDVAGLWRVLLFAVAAVLALFVIALDQADYPTTAWAALRRTGPMVANVVAAAWLDGVAGESSSEQRYLAGAHWTLTSLLAALCVSLVAVVVLALRSPLPEMRENRGLARNVVLPLALLAGVACVLVSWPLLRAARRGLPALVPAALWAAQTSFTALAWMRQSVFFRRANSPEDRARAEAMGAWNQVGALALAGVMAGLLWVIASTAR